MTTYNKTSLKAFFETNDIPTGQNYADLIDSQVNIVETSAQAMGGALSTTELITPRVSATTIVASTITASASITTATIFATLLDISGTIAVSAPGSLALNINGNMVIGGDVSAPSASIYASAMRSTNGLFSGVGIVSAAGTSQGTAAVLTNVINRGKGVVDGTTTGFTPLANRAGLVQYLYNEGASANLWPPTGGTINGLAVNAAFPLATSAMVTIVHLTASAMAVK